MYKVIKLKNKFKIIELASSNVIKVFDNHDDAHELYTSLRSGAGFEGWTPSFILTEVHIDNN